jgi:hypothetical protein
MRFFSFLLLLLTSFTGFAQTEISGTIQNSKGETIPGVNVWIKDTYDGASTNAEGVFSFKTTPSDSLVLMLSAIGFQPREMLLAETKNLSITLKTQVNELNAVAITAGTIEVSDKANSVVMKPLDIYTTAGSMGDITGALATLPGTATVGNDGRLFVRGGDASEVGIFFDGLRVGNAYGTTANNVPTRNRFSPVLFKGTFFSTGGYSAEFGDALSSVLSLETIDRPARNQSDFSFMSVGATASSTFVGEKQSVTAEGAYINLAPYQSVVKQYFDWEKAPRSLDGQVIYRHDLGKEGIIKGFLMGSRSEMALWQSPVSSEDRGILMDIQNDFGFANVSYELPLKNKWLLEGGSSLSLNSDKIDLDTARYNTSQDLLHIKQKATHYFSSSFKLRMGAEVFLSEYTEKDLDLDAEQGFTDRRSSVWTEAEWYLNERWTVRGGLRGSHFEESNSARLEPRFAAAYKVYDKGSLSFAAGSFSQAQSERNRTQEPGISYASADHLQMSFQHGGSERTFRAEVYYKDYDGLALAEGAALTTNGSGYAQGFDLFYRERKLIRNADFWITYSFVDSKRQFNNFQSQVRPSFAPEHNFSAVVKYWIGSLKSQVGATFMWNSGMPFDNPNLAGEMESTAPDFASLSLNWSYLYRQNLIIHASVSNVNGRDNIFGYRYSDEMNPEGVFDRDPIRQSAPFFAFIGIFWTLSSDKTANQLNNL